MRSVLAMYVGVGAAIFLSTLDQTALVTALPLIVADIGGFSSYSWAVTSYVLAMTVVVPVYGKLVDVYGARRLLAVATAIFVGGSALCSIADGMTELVVYRVLQGLGGGGLLPVGIAAIGRTVAPRERGRYIAIIGGVLAAASIAGPTVGGALADGPGWRWIFILNIPVGVIALAVVWFAMPRDDDTRARARAVDWRGAALLAGASGLFLLGLVWGGHEYAWSSAQVTLAFVAAGELVAVLVLVERRVRDPIMPFALMRRPAVATGIAALTLVSMAMLGTIVFVPFFVQGVVGRSATDAGVLIAPFMLSAVLASIVAGQIAARTGRYKATIVVGLSILVAGLALIWRMDAETSSGDVVRNAILAGVGIGLGMQLLLVSVQNAVPVSEMGGSTALLHFTRSLGGAIGVSVMGVIAVRDLPRGLDLRGPVPERIPEFVASALTDALRPAFLFALIVCACALVLVLVVLREEPLRAEIEPTPRPLESGP